MRHCFPIGSSTYRRDDERSRRVDRSVGLAPGRALRSRSTPPETGSRAAAEIETTSNVACPFGGDAGGYFSCVHDTIPGATGHSDNAVRARCALSRARERLLVETIARSLCYGEVTKCGMCPALDFLIAISSGSFLQRPETVNSQWHDADSQNLDAPPFRRRKRAGR